MLSSKGMVEALKSLIISARAKNIDAAAFMHKGRRINVFGAGRNDERFQGFDHTLTR